MGGLKLFSRLRARFKRRPQAPLDYSQAEWGFAVEKLRWDTSISYVRETILLLKLSSNLLTPSVHPIINNITPFVHHTTTLPLWARRLTHQLVTCRCRKAIFSFQDGAARELWFPEDGTLAAELGHLELMKSLNEVRSDGGRLPHSRRQNHSQYDTILLVLIVRPPLVVFQVILNTSVLCAKIIRSSNRPPVPPTLMVSCLVARRSACGHNTAMPYKYRNGGSFWSWWCAVATHPNKPWTML